MESLVLSMHVFVATLSNKKQSNVMGLTQMRKLSLMESSMDTILGPTLFCKHITGMESTTPVSSVLLYADDTETHHLSPTLQTAILKINSNLQNIST